MVFLVSITTLDYLILNCLIYISLVKLQILDVNVFRHLPLGSTRTDYLEIYFQFDKASLFSSWRNLQCLAAVAAVIGIRFLGLRSVFICSAIQRVKSLF